MKETQNYVPLAIEVVEVQMEKGYAGSGGTQDYDQGQGIW